MALHFRCLPSLFALSLVSVPDIKDGKQTWQGNICNLQVYSLLRKGMFLAIFVHLPEDPRAKPGNHLGCGTKMYKRSWHVTLQSIHEGYVVGVHIFHFHVTQKPLSHRKLHSKSLPPHPVISKRGRIPQKLPSAHLWVWFVLGWRSTNKITCLDSDKCPLFEIHGYS